MGAVRSAGWSKRIDTKVSILLGLHLPLFLRSVKIGERRPLRKRGTAVGLLYRRGAHCAPISRYIRSSRLPYCYTYRLLYAGATQGELPEGQERVPWGIPVSRNSFVRYYGRHLRIFLVLALYLTFSSLLTLHSSLSKNSYLFTPNSYLTEALNNAKKEPSFEDSFSCNFGSLSGEITPQP